MISDTIQIAVNEGLPYEEVKQTPYAVLCTTSLGGHLSWFEIGGHRWHAWPVGFSPFIYWHH
jgi:predicted alpha/beta-fold hydrolase